MTRSVLTVALAVAVLAAGPLRAEAQSPATPSPPPATSAPSASPLERALGRVLTLDDAVSLALEAQPNILARLNDYAAARFRVDQAFAPLLPQLSGQWTTTKSQSSQLTTLTGTGGQSAAVTVSRDFGDTMLAQIVLSQIIFDFGKNLASTDAARKSALVALEDVELQRQLITQEVKVQYTNINFAQRLIRVQQQAVERAELNLRSARGFFEVGTRPRSDVTRAEVDVANARVDVIRAQNAERLARVALNAAIGFPSGTQLQIEDNLVYEKVVIDSTSLLEQALRQRPEYRQARLRTEAADALVRRSFRDFFPDISGSGAYGAARSTFDEAWSVGLSLNWSIFDGGNRIARYREARANLDASQARVKASELDISREVEQARSTVVETEERILAAQKAVESAQENFRLAQGRFDAGVGTILELTDAQLALTQAQNTEAQALADFRVALARLDRSLGRR